MHRGDLTVYYSFGLVQMIPQGEGCLEHTIPGERADFYFIL